MVHRKRLNRKTRHNSLQVGSRNIADTVQFKSEAEKFVEMFEKKSAQKERGGKNERSDKEIPNSMQDEHSPNAEFKAPAKLLMWRTCRTIDLATLHLASSRIPENCPKTSYF